MNSNLNFEFRPVWYRPKPEPGRTNLTGNRSNRTGSHRFCKPWLRQNAAALEQKDKTLEAREAELQLKETAIATLTDALAQKVVVLETQGVALRNA